VNKTKTSPKNGKNITTFIVVSLIILAVAAVAFNLFRHEEPPCIQIPQELSTEQSKKALDVRSQLESAIKGKGDVAAKYDTILKQNFAKLSERNVTLYLFVQAIDCYLKHGDQASRDIAKTMTELLRAELANSSGSGSLSGPLTADEVRDINKSPYAAVILKRLSSTQ
jgi:biopolymer transport protein ExbD